MKGPLSSEWRRRRGLDRQSRKPGRKGRHGASARPLEQLTVDPLVARRQRDALCGQHAHDLRPLSPNLGVKFTTIARTFQVGFIEQAFSPSMS
jgi:hypothetical protein